MHPQLPLAVHLPDNARFENFAAGPNAELVESVHLCAAGQGEDFIYIWGTPGSGKSHLLQAACRIESTGTHAAVYLPMEELCEMPVAILEDLDKRPLVGIDDIQSIAKNADWEQGLFHFYNRLRAAGGRLLVAANDRPERLGIDLADLVSRLSAGVIYHIDRLADADLIQVLQLRAQQRGLTLPTETAEFLIRRMPRDLPALLALLERLDNASMAAQKALTIPFVKTVLAAADST